MSVRRRLRSTLAGRAKGVIIILLGLVLVIGAVDAWLIVRPRVNRPGRSAALVILGPSWPWRVARARELMGEGAADNLVVSAHPSDTPNAVPSPCSQPSPYPVYCFDPDPATTRGEARAIAELARQHHWDSVQVLTIAPQVERARVLLGRCYGGHVSFLTVSEDYSLTQQLMYQSGAFVKVWTDWRC